MADGSVHEIFWHRWSLLLKRRRNSVAHLSISTVLKLQRRAYFFQQNYKIGRLTRDGFPWEFG